VFGFASGEWNVTLEHLGIATRLSDEKQWLVAHTFLSVGSNGIIVKAESIRASDGSGFCVTRMLFKSNVHDELSVGFEVAASEIKAVFRTPLNNKTFMFNLHGLVACE